LKAIKTFHAIKQTESSEIVVRLSGELDLSVASDLADELQPVIRQNELGLVMDMKDLQYIDSTGIGIIVSILKTRTAQGAAFSVRNVPPNIKRLFDLTGISRHLATVSSSSLIEGNPSNESFQR
jgi:anti-sigma B factor antagonist